MHDHGVCDADHSLTVSERIKGDAGAGTAQWGWLEILFAVALLMIALGLVL
jgi:hypothetical protein